MKRRIVTAVEIVDSIRIPSNPDDYSGEDAERVLSGNLLWKLYTQINQRVGLDQSKAFTDTLKDLKKKSAPTVLKALYALEKRKWKYKPSKKVFLKKIRYSDNGAGSSEW